jgi:hypothetical protein
MTDPAGIPRASRRIRRLHRCEAIHERARDSTWHLGDPAARQRAFGLEHPPHKRGLPVIRYG